MTTETFYDAKDFDTAIEVDNYPWGYTLKTKRRYWVETTTRGDRGVYCTLNPKTGKWCKPKKRTYDAVVIVTRDDDGRVGFDGLGNYASLDRIADVTEWLDFEKLNDLEKAKIYELNAVAEVMEKVTWTIRETTTLTDAERDELDAEDKETTGKINKLIAIKAGNCMAKNGLTKEK